ncbi:hypothetical protein NIES2111_55760 [Nostoc sp. NIES-2111]|nr:hypothetical protein NIES2111_55760 [Nostoc sp. NIES-2111]
MLYQTPTPPSNVSIVHSENISCKLPVDVSVGQENKVDAIVIAPLAPPESFPAELSTPSFQSSCTQEQPNQQVVAQSVKQPVSSPESANINSAINTAPVHTSDAANVPQTPAGIVNITNTSPAIQSPTNTTNSPQTSAEIANTNNADSKALDEGSIAAARNLLLGVVINGREVGNLDVIQENNTLLIPLLDFAQITGFTVENIGDKTQLKTPAGVVTLLTTELKQINGITYISEVLLKEKLATNIELNSTDLALIVDVPWRRGGTNSNSPVAEIQPEVRPPSTGLSNLRQELQFTNNSGNTGWRSSTLLGGRLNGGSWRVRFENNFVDRPNISEYFFFKRSGRSLYQIGRQQISLNPLLSGVNLTGAQFGYTNLPPNRFNNGYGANELLPRRSQAIQTFRGVVPPASFVQLRVSGIIIAQQQVGLNGEYEFIDINLPPGQSNDLELLVFDRNNPNTPTEIRSLRFNTSDLLLPSGGNIQLAGLGLTGNFIQNALFDDINSNQSGKLTGFYQVRQGLSNNFTLEGAVQLLPETTQAQAGFIWRFASPAILAAGVGTSRGQIGYTADLDVQLDRLQIIGNSELYPSQYLYSSQSRDRFNHSLELKYKFSNNFNLGVVARNRQDQNNGASYVAPTFLFRPLYNLSLSGRPDFQGRYLFNAFYQMSPRSRLSFNSFGDIYTTDFGYNFNREYQLSFGTEFGGDLASRYTLTLNRSASSLRGLSWRLGMAYSDGEVGPIVGANMQLIPGLFARVDYQAIPSRTRSFFGGFGDERLTISLVSDLSFAGGRVAPSDSISMDKSRGGIGGQILVEGGRQGFDLSGSRIRVYNQRNQIMGGAKTDSQGNFFVGSLPEGIYVVELEPEQLPVELSLRKTTIIAEVAGAAVTKLDFPAKIEYGVAGQITDASGKVMPNVEVELVNAEGKPIGTTVTDEFGLYRLDGVPVGKYKLRVPVQDGIANNDALPQLEVAINKEFIYGQNLQLPIAAATKENEEKQQPQEK